MANAANYMGPVIQVSGVRKIYGRTVAVDEVSLEVGEDAFSGLFVPIASLPRVLHAVARVLPLVQEA